MGGEERRVLAMDVGGTKVIVALYGCSDSLSSPHVREVYASRDFESFAAILRKFQDRHPDPVLCAACAVAGPVREGRAEVTNLGWVVDREEIADRRSIPEVALLNDLEALATAVPHLDEQELHTLWPGEPAVGGAIGVAAPGTGLGEAYLTWNGREYTAHPSEGGHCSFSPTTAMQVGLLSALLEEYGHVSIERVGSGLGLPVLYQYLREGRGLVEVEDLAGELAGVEDPTPIIVRAATEGRSELCAKTVELFVEILGSELGNLALKLEATGGIYLGGGIPPRILPFLGRDAFLNAFRGKGRLEPMLSRIPVHVILEGDAVLRGAALRARATCGK